MDTVIRQHVKGYDIVERIGVGGFGAVYRARQRGVEREVAIKAILPDVAQQPDFIRRFEAEAQLIARLEHMHIVPLYDYWRDSEGTYLVMRWLRGGSLAGRLTNGAIPLEESGQILTQIASALATAHQHDIVHRDIKPANILLDEEGNAYLTDFGIAKDNTKPDGSVTAADVIIGSLDYISPEQARAEAVAPRTDIYSLGVVLYEMLTGEHPFPNITSVERMYKHMNDPLPEITNLPLKLVDQINQVIQKATAKKPADRYENVNVFAEAFLEAAHLKQQPMPESLVEILTPREQEILQLMINGLSNREIADQLVISISTVKNTQSHLYRKLRVKNRVQAIARGRELELLFGDGDLTPTLVDATSSILATMPEPENPYKGLRAFHSADSQDFFGREAVTQKLVNRLKQDTQWQRFLAVVGPSGSGKSSLVRAGLIPAIWRGEFPGSDRWFTVEMLPGSHPIDKLEVTLQRASSHPGTLQEHLKRDGRGLLRATDLILPDDDSQLLLVIDQFEELFTLVEDEAVREHFMDLLFSAVADTRSRIWIVVTLRADFYDRPLRYRDLGELMQSRTETILPLSADELERAIVSPAARVGVNFEGGLVPTIMDEVNYQPGALPLLQFALTELFERRENRTLTQQAFRSMGGTVGALANRADKLFNEFNRDGQETTRQMFLRLVMLGEGVEDTRRRTPRQELLAIADDPDLMDEIIDTYAAYRLLSLDHDPANRQPMVEVAHEAILREWARLRNWINEARDDIRMQQQLARMSDEWNEADHDDSFLARGSRLDQLAAWVSETQLAITAPERAFLDASLNERNREEKAERSRREHEAKLEQRAYRRLQAIVGVLAIAFVIGIVLSFAVFQQSLTAQKERDRAEAARDESQSVALAANAREIFERPEGRGVALALALEANKVPNPLPVVQQTLTDIAFAPGMRYIRDMGGPILDFDITPDGSQVLTGQGIAYDLSTDSITSTDLVLWDVQSGEEVRRFIGHTDAVFGIAIRPDGQSAISSSLDGTIIQWNLATGEQIRHFEWDGDFAPYAIDISPDGTRLIASMCSEVNTSENCIGNSEVLMWDIETGQVLQTYAANGLELLSDLTFSPDGRYFYIGSRAFGDGDVVGSILKWDVESGELIYDHVISSSLLLGIVVSPDGKELVTSFETGSIFHLNAETGEVLPTFQETGIVYTYNVIFRLALSPDGKLLLTGSRDGVIRIWDMTTGQEIDRFFGHTHNVSRLLFTPDGRQVISASFDDTLRLWDVVHSSEVHRYEAPPGLDFTNFHVSSDGKSIYAGIGTLDPTVTLDEYALVKLDIETGQELGRWEGVGNSVMYLAMSPDETRAAVSNITVSYDYFGIYHGEFDRAIQVWDLENNEIIAYLNPDTTLDGIVFSPDGRFVAGASEENIVYVWDAETGEIIHRLLGDGPRDTVAFSPDSKLIASGGWGPMNVWDAQTGELLASYAENIIHTNIVRTTEFMPDGRTLFTSSTDGTLQLWDSLTGEVYLRVEGLGDLAPAALSMDSRYAVYGTSEYEIVLLDLVTGDELARFAGHTDNIYHLEFSPDDRRIFSVAADGTLRIWEIPPHDPDALIAWAEANRVVPELTAEQRELFRLEQGDSEPLSQAIFSPIVNDTPTVDLVKSVEDITITAQSAILGENRGSIAVGEMGVWTYDGTAGEVLSIAALADSPAPAPIYFQSQLAGTDMFNTYLRIRDPNGVELARNDDILGADNTNALIKSVKLPENGVYQIEVRGVGYLTGGSYTLVIEQDSAP